MFTLFKANSCKFYLSTNTLPSTSPISFLVTFLFYLFIKYGKNF